MAVLDEVNERFGRGTLAFGLSSTGAAWRDHEGALLVLQLAFTAINILGVYRWLLARIRPHSFKWRLTQK